MRTKRNKFSILSTLLFFLAFSTIISGHRRKKLTTITATVTYTFTATTTKSTNTVCASVSSESSSPVTACRRRRQYWIDVPFYIALDDHIDDQLSQFFILPANVVQVEPTADPATWFKGDQSSESSDNDELPVNLIPSQSIEPSWFTPDLSNFEPQIFGRLANHLMFGRRRRKKTIVVTSTQFATSTKTETTYTSTNTFFIFGCTPSSFPYSYC